MAFQDKRMSSPIRHIALTVEKNASNGYLWLLIESVQDHLVVFERSAVPSGTYLRALTAGFEYLALLSASGLHDRTPESVVREGREVFPRQHLELVG